MTHAVWTSFRSELKTTAGAPAAAFAAVAFFALLGLQIALAPPDRVIALAIADLAWAMSVAAPIFAAWRLRKDTAALPDLAGRFLARWLLASVIVAAAVLAIGAPIVTSSLGALIIAAIGANLMVGAMISISMALAQAAPPLIAVAISVAFWWALTALAAPDLQLWVSEIGWGPAMAQASPWMRLQGFSFGVFSIADAAYMICLIGLGLGWLWCAAQDAKADG